MLYATQPNLAFQCFQSSLAACLWIKLSDIKYSGIFLVRGGDLARKGGTVWRPYRCDCIGPQTKAQGER